MSAMIQILDLLNQKKILEFELHELIYGSIEVREANNNKYIYTHVREDGILLTKYAGEYSEVLEYLIKQNNNRAKELKKTIRSINKKLKDLNYIDYTLNKEVGINVDFARKHIVDTIYNQAVLEGVALTYSDTENIVEGLKVSGLTAQDIMKVINLKHAWDFILNQNVLLSKTSFSLLCTINKFVQEGFYYTAGYLRNVPVKIGGTTWTPDIPIESDVISNINNILNSEKNDIDIAIDLLLYVSIKQLFFDGNKRTAVIFANHYLISKGKGMIVIPAKKAEDYKKILVNYYETNDSTEIIKFLKSYCYIKL